MSTRKGVKETPVTKLLKEWRATSGLSQREVDRLLAGGHDSSRFTQQVESGRILPGREACETLCEVFEREFDLLWGQVMRVKAGPEVTAYFDEQIQIASRGEIRTEKERGLFNAMRNLERHYATDVAGGLMGLLTSSLTMSVRTQGGERPAPMKMLSNLLHLYGLLPLDVQRIVLEDCEQAARRATQILMRTRTTPFVKEDPDVS
jgi:hypothetical protein